MRGKSHEAHTIRRRRPAARRHFLQWRERRALHARAISAIDFATERRPHAKRMCCSSFLFSSWGGICVFPCDSSRGCGSSLRRHRALVHNHFRSAEKISMESTIDLGAGQDCLCRRQDRCFLRCGWGRSQSWALRPESHASHRSPPRMPNSRPRIRGAAHGIKRSSYDARRGFPMKREIAVHGRIRRIGDRAAP